MLFRVCRKWKVCVDRTKKKRKNIGWFLYHNEGNDNGGSGIADEMRDKVDKFLDVRTSS